MLGLAVNLIFQNNFCCEEVKKKKNRKEDNPTFWWWFVDSDDQNSSCSFKRHTEGYKIHDYKRCRHQSFEANGLSMRNDVFYSSTWCKTEIANVLPC